MPSALPPVWRVAGDCNLDGEKNVKRGAPVLTKGSEEGFPNNDATVMLPLGLDDGKIDGVEDLAYDGAPTWSEYGKEAHGTAMLPAEARCGNSLIL